VAGAKTSTSLLRNGLFRRFWLAQFASLTGGYAIYFTSIVLIEELTHSSARTSLVILSSTMPGLLFGLLAGVVVDRLSRRRILIISNALRGLVALGFLWAIIALPCPSLVLIVYLVNFFLSTLTQFLAPAEGALLPRLVGEEKLMAANSLFNLSNRGAEGVGMMILAPALIKLAGAEAVYGMGAVFYALAAISLGVLPREEVAQSRNFNWRAATWEVWAELRQGWRYVRSDRSVSFAIFQLTLTNALLLMLGALVPGYVSRVLGLRVEDVAYMALPTGVGLALGMALVSKRGNWMKKEWWINLGLFISGSVMAVFAVGQRIVLWSNVMIGSQLPSSYLLILAFLILSAFFGLGLALVLIPARAILQARPPDRLRGRTISLQFVLVNLASLLPMFFAGALADQVGIPLVMMLIAVTTFVSGVAGSFLIAKS
jgi:MFS family permease